MKHIKIIFFLLISFNLIYAQETRSPYIKRQQGLVFETIESSLYYPDNLSEDPRIFEGGFLIEIQEKEIITSGHGRFAKFKYTREWEKSYVNRESGGGYRSTLVRCIDPAGSPCTIELFYVDDYTDDKTKAKGIYFLTILYDSENQMWIHSAYPSAKEIYIGPDDIRPHNVRDFNKNPYTQEEWDIFFNEVENFAQTMSDIWYEMKYLINQ